MSATAAGWLQVAAAGRRAGRWRTARWATTWPASSPRRGTRGSSAASTALIGRRPRRRPDAGRVYLRSVLAFSAVVGAVPVRVPAAAGPPLAVARASAGRAEPGAGTPRVSFVTNTNWQSYSGESTMGHLVQMAGLAVQNFVSAAVGIAVVVALIRGFARAGTDRLGNFWVDLTRVVPAGPAAARVRRRDRPGRRRRDPEPPRRHRRHHARRRARRASPAGRSPRRRRSRSSAPTAAASTTPTPRTRSRTRTRWTNLLADLPAAGDPVLAAAHVRPDGRRHPAGLRDRRGHGACSGPASVALLTSAELAHAGHRAAGSPAPRWRARRPRFGVPPSALFAARRR